MEGAGLVTGVSRRAWEPGGRVRLRRGEGGRDRARGAGSHKRTQHVGDVVGSHAWADGRTKTNVAQKNVHTLFFFVVGDVWHASWRLLNRRSIGFFDN